MLWMTQAFYKFCAQSPSGNFSRITLDGYEAYLWGATSGSVTQNSDSGVIHQAIGS